MSQICPHCGQGFQRLASHEWRCKAKGSSSGFGARGSSCYSSSSVNNSFFQPALKQKTRCSRCGNYYVDISNHKICHGTRSDVSSAPVQVMMQVCPDCGKCFKDLSNHHICHGRKSKVEPAREPARMKQKCPDCGKSFADLSNHEICYGRRPRAEPATTPPVVEQICPDCGQSVTNLATHRNVCWASGIQVPECSVEPLDPQLSLSVYPTPPPTPSREFIDSQGSQFVSRVNGGLSEDDALAAAVAGSLDSFEAMPATIFPVNVIQRHQAQCLSSNAESVRVNRDDVWGSSLSYFKNLEISDQSNILMVLFTDGQGNLERAVDGGGCRREYFRLLLNSIINDSKMLQGNKEDGMLIRPNISQYSKKNFRALGAMLATIIVQGGEPPAVLAAPVVDAILGKDPLLSLENVPSTEVRESLKQVSRASDGEELDEALEDCEWRFDLDGLPTRINMDNKAEFVKQAIYYFVLVQSQPMLDQVIEGLKHCKVLELLRKHQLRDLLQFDESKSLTTTLVMTMLTPSFTSTSEHQREQDIVSSLQEFLEAIEDENLCETLLEDMDLTDEETDFAETLTLETFLAFVTGSSREPVGGFRPLPALVFHHGDTWRMPYASTCSNQLHFSIGRGSCTSSRLSYKLLTAMMNSETFTTE